METRFTILLIEVGAAIVIQVALLAAVLAAVKKSTKRMESLADEIQRRALPTLDVAQQLITTAKPQIEEIIANAAESTATMKAQLERLDDTVSDIVDRTRLHVIRADNLVGQTLDRVEHTTELVHTTVISPIRQISAVVQGLTAGLTALLGRHAKPNGSGAQQRDEMFI
jgi:archaellum component FlaC